MKRKGLTLMELLTVISILATLAALLYPVYLRVRSRAYAVQCATQLYQIGLAIKMYVNDQGDETPYLMPPYAKKLYPTYVSDKNLLVCPYFQTIAPEVVEEMHQIHLTRYGTIWSSYVLIWPPARDDIAKRAPGETESFSEAFALRGDQTPIVVCEAHRTGCPHFMGVNFITVGGPKARAFAKTYCVTGALADPSAPIVILRWGGSVDLVYKGGLLFHTQGFLLEY